MIRISSLKLKHSFCTVNNFNEIPRSLPTNLTQIPQNIFFSALFSAKLLKVAPHDFVKEDIIFCSADKKLPPQDKFLGLCVIEYASSKQGTIAAHFRLRV